VLRSVQRCKAKDFLTGNSRPIARATRLSSVVKTGLMLTDVSLKSKFLLSVLFAGSIRTVDRLFTAGLTRA
jgi:hypothetical protein